MTCNTLLESSLRKLLDDSFIKLNERDKMKDEIIKELSQEEELKEEIQKLKETIEILQSKEDIDNRLILCSKSFIKQQNQIKNLKEDKKILENEIEHLNIELGEEILNKENIENSLNLKIKKLEEKINIYQETIETQKKDLDNLRNKKIFKIW